MRMNTAVTAHDSCTWLVVAKYTLLCTFVWASGHYYWLLGTRCYQTHFFTDVFDFA